MRSGRPNIRVETEVKLANCGDLVATKRGLLPPIRLRKLTATGVVSRRSSRLALPASIAKKLGLVQTGKIKIKYANGRVAKRDTADVHLELQGRHGIYSAIVEPRRTEVVIGTTILADLDLLVDENTRTLCPRDPRFVIVEIG